MNHRQPEQLNNAQFPAESEPEYTLEEIMAEFGAPQEPEPIPEPVPEPEPGRRPSLVLCRPKKGESLWELAKRYRTDEQAICAANGLEQETPLPSGLLLIPRVR